MQPAARWVVVARKHLGACIGQAYMVHYADCESGTFRFLDIEFTLSNVVQAAGRWYMVRYTACRQRAV